ncbi:MAG: cation transporter, partial [Haloarculaceae archaeon]
MADSASGGCTLCDLPLAETSVEDDAGRPFCCRGCRDVYGTLGDVADVSEADVRDALDGGEGEKTASATDTGSVPEGHERTFLRIEGMHCATCEAFIEARLGAEPGVSDAEASYVTETVRVDFDPDGQTEDDLIDAVSGLGYTAFRREDSMAKRRAEDWLQYRLIVGVLFGMMVMLQYVTLIYPLHFNLFYSESSMELLRQIATSGSSRYFFAVVALLSGIVLFGTGAPILRGAYVSLRARQPNMDLLVAVAAVSAYLYSTLAVLLGRVDIYYDVTVAIVLVVTAGNYYEREIKRKATDRLSDLTVAQVD